MFGLEDQKKKKDKGDEFIFELEKEVKDRTHYNKVKERIDGRIQLIKETLRSGESKEEFDRFGMLLHGYTAFLKVMARLKTVR